MLYNNFPYNVKCDRRRYGCDGKDIILVEVAACPLKSSQECMELVIPMRLINL